MEPRFTLYPNLPSGNKCANANSTKWSSDKNRQRGFIFPVANIISFSTTKWGASHISKTSLVAVRYKLPESPASEKFSSSKKLLIVYVAESFEKSKISFLLNLKENITFFIDLLG